MRVLFIALGAYAGVGGLERFNQRVVTALAGLAASEGLEARVIALWDTAPEAAAAPAGVAFTPGGRSKLRAAAAFARDLLRRRPDVVLYGHVLLSPLALLARVLSPRSRHVLFAHGREVWRESFRSRIPLWERLAVLAGIDRVAAVSRLTAGRMSAAYGVPAARFCLLPNAVDEPLSAPGHRNNGGGEQRLLTVARLSRKDRCKGCDKVIQAMPAVLAQAPGARYEVVGDGPLRAELEQLARDLGVSHAVRFRGRVDDRELERIYRDAHVMVMPSTGEGFGIVYLEAWKHGLPVVAGDRDAGSEVVADGVDGLCVNPASVDSIARALVDLLNHPDKAAAMGRRGYQKVMERYTHAHFLRNLRQILQA